MQKIEARLFCLKHYQLLKVNLLPRIQFKACERLVLWFVLGKCCFESRRKSFEEPLLPRKSRMSSIFEIVTATAQFHFTRHNQFMLLNTCILFKLVYQFLHVANLSLNQKHLRIIQFFCISSCQRNEIKRMSFVVRSTFSLKKCNK